MYIIYFVYKIYDIEHIFKLLSLFYKCSSLIFNLFCVQILCKFFVISLNKKAYFLFFFNLIIHICI